ncbi:hypothetical protein [Nodularia chucula]|uniref:hypothetical protein n=1 Tax=Nodularia chucula TaxID=3093667 RepID=UPI0039C66687
MLYISHFRWNQPTARHSTLGLTLSILGGNDYPNYYKHEFRTGEITFILPFNRADRSENLQLLQIKRAS